MAHLIRTVTALDWEGWSEVAEALVGFCGREDVYRGPWRGFWDVNNFATGSFCW